MSTLRSLRWRYENITRREVVSLPAVPPVRGRALLGYLNAPVGLDENARQLRGGHTNRWESWKIAGLLSSLGYDVDAINFNDTAFVPSKRYDAHFDISTNLARLSDDMPDALRLMHVTGSYPRFSNAAEAKRGEEMERRSGVHYELRRQVPELDLFDRSIELADRVSLIGNEVTLSTFPERFREKMTLVTVSSSMVFRRGPEDLVPAHREFLWFNGTGAVHKGLDLTLEAFRKLPDLRLHVVGNADREMDFMQAYGKDLLHSTNVTYHGWLSAGSGKLRKVLERCCCFISPSCSEGISTASTTMMQAGLLPVISRNNGIDLPPGGGIYLEENSVEEIVQRINEVAEMPAPELRRQAGVCQAKAVDAYSRERFTEEMSVYLSSSLAGQIKD